LLAVQVTIFGYTFVLASRGLSLFLEEVVNLLAEILEEVAQVCNRDADVIYDSYRWPPRPKEGPGALTLEERREAERLMVLGRRMWLHSVEVRAGIR
jgi:hypothetical protein